MLSFWKGKPINGKLVPMASTVINNLACRYRAPPVPAVLQKAKQASAPRQPVIRRLL
jgi:hypothetical protein